jgi:hypothetical protein
MAIYHLTVSTGAKSAGHSARAKAEYVSREGAYTHDRAELVHVESAHMPDWALVKADGSASAAAIPYWEAADVHERANGRLFKQLEFALPLELPADARLELARAFARELTTNIDGGQLPYTLAVHAGKGDNPHVHLLISERVNDGQNRSPAKWFKRAVGKDGGARKTEALKPTEWLDETRARWADLTNEALSLAGSKERVDHRSLYDQGIDRAPGVHMGPRLAAMVARGLSPERAELRAVPMPELQRRMNQLEQDYEEITIELRRLHQKAAPPHRPDLGPAVPASASPALRAPTGSHEPAPPFRMSQGAVQSAPEFSHARTSQAPARPQPSQPPSPPPTKSALPPPPSAAAQTLPKFSQARTLAPPLPPQRPPHPLDGLPALRRTPAVPLAEAFATGLRRAEGLARLNVEHGIWKDHRRDASDFRLARELIRAGYPPRPVGEQFTSRAKRQPEYVERTIRSAYAKEKELAQDRGR